MKDRQLFEQFGEAIELGNLKLARDLVTLMDTSAEEIEMRLIAYREIVDTAIELGQIEIAMEAAPFCGRKLSRKDYQQYFFHAAVRGNIRSVDICVKYMR